MLPQLFGTFFLHPAIAGVGGHAAHPSVLEGFFHVRRIGYPMATIAETFPHTPGPGRMIVRFMRNMLITLTIFLIVGNVSIFLAFRFMAGTGAARPLPAIPTIENLHSVDAALWRGSAPGRAGYEGLAERGVTTIVDLRAEDIRVDEDLITSLGMELVRIPIRDGQAPSQNDVDRFLAVMKDNEGLVYVHCGAGVGRTGTLAAAYLVNGGQATAMEALQRNLAVGPPSLEQISFVLSLQQGEETEAGSLVTAVSRVLDAPRRLLVRVRNSYGH